MLYNRSGGLDSFFVVENGVTLTIENIIEGQIAQKTKRLRSTMRRRVSLRL